MSLTDLIPWRWGAKKVPVKHKEERPLDRWLDDWTSLVPFADWADRWQVFSPSVDVVENDQEVKVSAELPGLEAEDIDLTLSEHQLTISGEKKAEKEEKGKNYYRMERSYGSFQRVIPLPQGVDATEVDARFKNGVLNIVLPKTAQAQKTKIHVKSE